MQPSLHGNYYEELWQECAGSFVTIPRNGEEVMYFPQGHMEQVTASMDQTAQLDMPQYYNLPSNILCRVVSMQLRAEKDTDEIFAQLSLLPLEVSDTLSEEECVPPPRRNIRLFCKKLTASDTSTHGGFSVPRKNAEECLPLLDMNQNPPAQDLVALDLHGQEWHFRHIYRGVPRRHLLTTGWSLFVTQKKLVAGDTVIFLRGDTGELRVGIRRALRQYVSQQSSVLSSHSMCMGILATAFHAIATKTTFSVFYKPSCGTSPAEFIVPYHKYINVAKVKLTPGMRIRMRLKTEDTSAQSYMGTISKIGDLDPVRWKESKWRSLTVTWDEHKHAEKVSPWEIEVPTTPATEIPAIHKGKRLRIGNPSFEQTKELPAGMVLQGQKLMNLRDSLSSKVEYGVWPPNWSLGHLSKDNKVLMEMLDKNWEGRSITHSAVDSTSESKDFNSFDLIPSDWGNHHLKGPLPMRHIYQQKESSLPEAPVPPFLASVQYTHPSYSQPEGCQNLLPTSVSSSQKELVTSIQDQGPMQWPYSESPWRSSSFDPNVPSTTEPSKLLTSSTVVHREDVGMSSSAETFEKALPTGMEPHQLPSIVYSEPTLSSEPPRDRLANGACQAVNNCKIFGFSLTCNLAPSPLIKDEAASLGGEHAASNVSTIHKQSNGEKVTKLSTLDATLNSKKNEPATRSVLKEEQCRDQPNRNFIKVMRKGIQVGRKVDLSKLEGYDMLMEELECMFHLQGELVDGERGWRVVYCDNEGDMLLVGDDPWQEFCCIAKKMFIQSPEEVGAGIKNINMHGYPVEA